MISSWSTLERLLLAQAIYKYGEQGWPNIVRVLRQHPICQHQPIEQYSQKNCVQQYHEMLQEFLDNEQEPENREDKIQEVSREHDKESREEKELGSTAMPQVVRIAKILQQRRIDELKSSIANHEEKLKELVSRMREMADKMEMPMANTHMDTKERSKTEHVGKELFPDLNKETRQRVIKNKEDETQMMDEKKEDLKRDAIKKNEESVKLTHREKFIEQEQLEIASVEQANNISGMEEDEKPEMDEQRRRAWKKSILMVLRDICSHKNAPIFMHPVKEDDAPGYYNVVKRPMDLTTIRRCIEDGIIKTTEEFHRDLVLMFLNAIMYNREEHEIYEMAKDMKSTVEHEIETFKLTEQDILSPVRPGLRSGRCSDVELNRLIADDLQEKTEDNEVSSGTKRTTPRRIPAQEAPSTPTFSSDAQSMNRSALKRRRI